MDSNGLALAAMSGGIVSGVDPIQARAHGDAIGVRTEFAGDSVRFNKGFPNGIEPFSIEAKRWAQSSPVYQDRQTRWHRIQGELGC